MDIRTLPIYPVAKHLADILFDAAQTRRAKIDAQWQEANR